jgi:hypothetical protein
MCFRDTMGRGMLSSCERCEHETRRCGVAVKLNMMDYHFSIAQSVKQTSDIHAKGMPIVDIFAEGTS